MNKYKIPLNFGGGSKLIKGQFEIRQVVETAVLVFITALLISRIVPINLDSISLYIIVCGIVGFATLEITKRDSIVTIVTNILRWRKLRKKPYVFNNNPETFLVSGSALIEDQTNVRDMLASSFERFRKKHKKERPKYIEGENFAFAEDPMLASLRQRTEDLRAEREQERLEKEQAEKAAEERAKADATLPNMDNILEAVSEKFNTEDNQ